MTATSGNSYLDYLDGLIEDYNSDHLSVGKKTH